MIGSVITLYVMSLVVAGWAMVCNERTYTYRKRLNARVYQLRRQRIDQGLDPFVIQYPEVSYHRHFWRIFFFRRVDDLYEVCP